MALEFGSAITRRGCWYVQVTAPTGGTATGPTALVGGLARANHL
jgi:hypothetical protein